MLWVIIERAVHLATLVLLVVMLSIIFINNKSSEDLSRIDLKIEQNRADRIKSITTNMEYVDGRLNRLSEAQDNYQVLIDRRLHIMEVVVKGLSEDARIGQKIVNTNNNVNTNNVR